MKGIDKFAKVLMKVLEIVHWVVSGIMTAAVICAAVAPQYLGYFAGFEISGGMTELSVYGFDVAVPVLGGMPDMTAFILFGIGAIIILILMSMIFRNMYLIIKKSEGRTPFQMDNVRMLREIGIFSIGVPIIGFVMGIVMQVIVGSVEVSNSLEGFIIGIFILCLTQFFAHGVELEDEMEGLV